MRDLHLTPLPDRVADLLGDAHPEVLELVASEHARWHGLHDRLIAIVVSLIDDAIERGEDLGDLLERVNPRASVGVANLVGAAPTPEDIAGLLRAHHSTGRVEEQTDRVVFSHDSGTGLAYWRRNPGAATVGDGEVPGVPGGVPRYCARCVTTIARTGDRWSVYPPASPDDHCRWEVDRT